MTPYGIVYKNNPFALEQSCNIWQEKFGILKPSKLLALSAVYIAIIFLALSLMVVFGCDFFVYISTALGLSGVFVFLIYFTAKNTYVKQIAKSKMSNEQKQAVLYDDKAVFVTPYTKYEFLYNEILYCHEKNGILTIILDSGMLPISIYSSCVGKGDFNEFCGILYTKLREDQRDMGGKI